MQAKNYIFTTLTTIRGNYKFKRPLNRINIPTQWKKTKKGKWTSSILEIFPLNRYNIVNGILNTSNAVYIHNNKWFAISTELINRRQAENAKWVGLGKSTATIKFNNPKKSGEETRIISIISDINLFAPPPFSYIYIHTAIYV